MRGGLTYVDALERRPAVTRLVGATRGNHGQSIAFAARAGLHATDRRSQGEFAEE